MRKIAIALTLVALACTSRPPAAPPADAVRTAIDTKYVGVPSMKVFAEPADVAPVITEYGYTETVSILSRRGDWVEVRTVDGSGWSKAADLIGAADVKAILDNPTPRFLTAPVTVPQPSAHGMIAMVARVNTDGDVVEAWKLADSTHSKKLIDANLAALRQAKFYPIVQKGQRLTFTYEYDVTY
ncbi:MAG TPA: SH3 domain-containing protein [Thermoanaerobaculia bacterium]|nr:SH3 domain-containing protein [Thermoanaerobaculia bacterium]